MSEYNFIAANKKLKSLNIGVDDKGYMIVIENEKHVLGIYEDEPNCYTEPFTNLPVIKYVEIDDLGTVEPELFDYAKDAIKENDTIELWATWMGETEGTEKKIVHEDDLTIEDIRWVYALNDRTHPRCLKIYKWTRGKK